jgi:hypothetical protein
MLLMLMIVLFTGSMLFMMLKPFPEDARESRSFEKMLMLILGIDDDDDPSPHSALILTHCELHSLKFGGHR